MVLASELSHGLLVAASILQRHSTAERAGPRTEEVVSVEGKTVTATDGWIVHGPMILMVAVAASTLASSLNPTCCPTQRAKLMTREAGSKAVGSVPCSRRLAFVTMALLPRPRRRQTSPNPLHIASQT